MRETASRFIRQAIDGFSASEALCRIPPELPGDVWVLSYPAEGLIYCLNLDLSRLDKGISISNTGDATTPGAGLVLLTSRELAEAVAECLYGDLSGAVPVRLSLGEALLEASKRDMDVALIIGRDAECMDAMWVR